MHYFININKLERYIRLCRILYTLHLSWLICKRLISKIEIREKCMLSKKFHFLEYDFQIYDERSPIPFFFPDGQIRKNVEPKIFQKSRKCLVKLSIMASQIQDKDLSACVFVVWRL